MGLPTSERAIAAAERELGRTLPTALRQRLLRNNGGDIEVRIPGEEPEEWQLHPVRDDSNRETLRRSANDLVSEQATAREWPDFPTGAISIAQYDGDQLILEAGTDQPLLWYHETADTEVVEVDWR
jgi:SMI1 / KNR4 family (SUKH-1)